MPEANNNVSMFGTGIDSEMVALKVDELERIFSIFHQDDQSFAHVELGESRKQTCVPHLKMRSNFFCAVTDDIYETVLEDLRDEYMQLCNE